jgi:hypothetical protein
MFVFIIGFFFVIVEVMSKERPLRTILNLLWERGTMSRPQVYEKVKESESYLV